ncbi:MAG: HupE/UreJ family protein [Gammaproteobacteria bacterium]|nr:HupE/UreJ family protein [Gammaproteobacteria bacterium]MBT5726031.1 HupE/UreJ family protein [Gammaproteobacteria bacterium]MBT6891671.1 HupE/UreJ family protein [Gammaproteobacteria bacterium]MBT7878929.1 HupE/UreJ family protein [Gammaproteobacteria bacterium]
MPIKSFLFALLLGLTSQATAHLLNMTEVRATIDESGDMHIDVKLDMLRANGTPEAYFEFAQTGSAALQDEQYQAMWQKLQQAIEIHQSGNVFHPSLVNITPPIEPLSAFQSSAAWPMTELSLTAKVNPALPMSMKFRSLFPFEEPIAIGMANSFDDRQRNRWVISNQSGPKFTSKLDPAAPAAAEEREDQWGYLLSALWQGVIHVLPLGYDHLLFLLCLYLAVNSWRERIATITLFTIAHCITLGIAAYRVIELSIAWVEVAIAASILVVALGNLIGNARSFSHWSVVFAFGLLHGFGFASAIRALSLPAESFLASLLAFNVGVEIGQITFLILLWMLLTPVSKRAFYQRGVAMPLNGLAALVAVYWIVERIGGV